MSLSVQSTCTRKTHEHTRTHTYPCTQRASSREGDSPLPLARRDSAEPRPPLVVAAWRPPDARWGCPTLLRKVRGSNSFPSGTTATTTRRTRGKKRQDGSPTTTKASELPSSLFCCWRAMPADDEGQNHFTIVELEQKKKKKPRQHGETTAHAPSWCLLINSRHRSTTWAATSPISVPSQQR